MGHSLSAAVFYGIDLGDDETRTEEQHDALPQWWRDDEDWEDVLAARLGWEDSVPYPQASYEQMMTGSFQDLPEYKAWDVHRKVRVELIADLGVKIDTHGYEFDGKAIRITESIQGCDYGAERLSTVFAPASRIRVWNDRLQRFCELLEFPYEPEKVGWHLCASWG